MDGHASLALEDAVRQAVEDSGSSGGGRPTEPCLEPDLLRALQVADRLLEERVEARMVRLRREARGLREDERARVEAYYDAVLDSIAERRDRAGAERRALYEAQAEAAQAERARRLQEIEDKHQPRSDRQPFRLHLLLVPAYRLPVQVRRGPRAYPYALVWLPVLRRFLPARCPACGERATLVAGRKGLGCAACVAQPTETVPPTPGPAPAFAPEVPAREPAPAERGDDGQHNRNLAPGAPFTQDEAPPDQLRLDLGSGGNLPAMSPPPAPTRQAPPPRETAARTRTHPEPERSEIRGDDDFDPDRIFADYRREARQVLRIGDELAFDFWQRVGTRKPWRRVVRDSPLAALYRLYGPVGPLYAIGAGARQRLERGP